MLAALAVPGGFAGRSDAAIRVTTAPMMPASTDTRAVRVWSIVIGMGILAATVIAVTTIIHNRIM
jgi:hypothetical protein